MPNITVSSDYIAFALSLLSKPSFSGSNISLVAPHLSLPNEQVILLELSQATGSPSPPVLLVHTNTHVPLSISSESHYNYSFSLPLNHQLLQVLPPTPFNTPLHLPHALTLPETHLLLSYSLHLLQLPPETISAWPHPLTLTFSPHWPQTLFAVSPPGQTAFAAQLHYSQHPNTTPASLKIQHNTIPTWHLEPHEKNLHTSSFVDCNLNSTSFHTPHTDPHSPPPLHSLAYHFLLHLFLPHLPPHWHLVRFDYLEPTALQPNHLQIVPLYTDPHAPPAPNHALSHCYASSLYSLLFCPPHQTLSSLCEHPLTFNQMDQLTYHSASTPFAPPEPSPTEVLSTEYPTPLHPHQYHLNHAMTVLNTSATTILLNNLTC